MLYIQETFVNEDRGHIFGESDWHESGYDTPGELFRALKAEYGNGSNMYRDRKDGSTIKVGWVFEGRARYEDTGEPYTRSVWVEVSETEPHTQLVNITHPWS